MYKEITLKDFTEGKTEIEILHNLPKWVYNKKWKHSYPVIGIDDAHHFIVHRDIQVEGDEFFGGGYDYDDGYSLVSFFDEEYVISDDPTPKQIEWLEHYRYNTNICGVEAWNIIHEAVEEHNRRKEAKKKYVNFDYDYDYEDDDRYDFEIPNR